MILNGFVKANIAAVGAGIEVRRRRGGNTDGSIAGGDRGGGGGAGRGGGDGLEGVLASLAPRIKDLPVTAFTPQGGNSQKSSSYENYYMD
jgi:hypothetical protein